MAVSVTMPRLGESVTEGTVTRWLKKEGERVEVDEPLLEVSTDKVDTEIPSPAAGTVSSIKVQEDETVEVGVELAVISDGADEPSAADPAPPAAPAAPEPAAAPAAQAPPVPAAEAPPAPAAEAPPAPAAPPAAPAAPVATAPVATAPAVATPPTAAASPPAASRPAPPAPAVAAGPGPDASVGGLGGGEGTYVTPLVRKLATEHGVDLASLQGTGVGGRVRKQDVLDAAGQGQGAPAAGEAATAPPTGAAREQIAQPTAAAATAPAPVYADQPVAAAAATSVRGRTEPLSRLRKVIGARMVESLQTSAQLTTVLEADVTAVARLRDLAKADFQAREGAKLTFMPFFAMAAVEALKSHPVVNSSIDTAAGTVTYHDDVHLGIAVDTDRGLLVPVIHGAGDLNLGGLARKTADLAERTRINNVTPDELGGGTFTLTNTGSRGALFDTPILNQPQVGILGTGAVVKRAVIVSDPLLGEVVAVRSMVYLALTYDHRIVDGADAARFLVSVKQRLEEGDFAAELGL